MHIVSQLLRADPGVRLLCRKWDRPGVTQIPGLSDAAKAPLLSLPAQEGRQILVIGADEDAVRPRMNDYYFYVQDALYYPARDLLFHHANVRGGEIDRMRSTVYQAIDQDSGAAIFLPAESLLDPLRSRESLHRAVLRISSGDRIDLPDLRRALTRMGYENEYQVEAPGQYAVRGGIIDIYTLSEEGAYRIELFDDEVDGIRVFDPATQRTIEGRSSVTVYPLETQEAQDGAAGDVSFLSYFDPTKTVIFFIDPDKCFARLDEVTQELFDSQAHRAGTGEAGGADEPPGVPDTFSPAQIRSSLAPFPVICLCSLDDPVRALEADEVIRTDIRSEDPCRSLEALTKELSSLRGQKARTVYVCASRTRARRLCTDLAAEGYTCFFTDDHGHPIEPGEVMVTTGRLRSGLVCPAARMALLTDGSAQQIRRQRPRRSRKIEGAERIRSFTDLHPGDYVVHLNHGIGIYRGIEQVEVQGNRRDYMKIEYAGSGVLYVQVDQFDLVQKYTGGEGKKPRLNTIGSKEWKKTRARVESSVDEIAQELVELYALRRENEGYVYGPDTVWQKEFEELFPYEETADQTAAIRAVKQDMESPKIMDRLLCGDVGFGKTEVAIRAAFKAVQENKQVAYLVPTTILAQQHYRTFTERMAHYPVRVDLLTRFQTSSSEVKDTLSGLKSGLVDIVIGTHRLLSKDVNFKDLGLLIIDEEQRFGVSHKEKIKQLKYNIDVLSLTATPIPRTLHMSLIGIRDVSLLEEPPQDRRPIETFVMEYDAQTVREAISRELKRGGQVYYVYNLVQNIADAAARVQALVPQAVVGYAHGQMRERELEDVMSDFIERRIDVLVSTTIVETGLDISNVNTMIIEGADRMGLAQLYQLRGRVGRSDRSSSCFLMYRKDKVLKETAEQRLSAIREFTALGSGIRVAMRDLEIRGAGNLLGKKQSGNMEAIGYELYSTLLNEAVQRAKGGPTQTETFQTDLDLGIEAYIPDSYIGDETAKLDVYKQIAAIGSRQDREQIEEELTDRFGPMPMVVELLLLVAEIKAAAHAVYLTSVKEKGSVIEMLFYEHARISLGHLSAFLHGKEKKVAFYPKPVPRLAFRPAPGRRREKLTELLDLLREMERITEKKLPEE